MRRMRRSVCALLGLGVLTVPGQALRAENTERAEISAAASVAMVSPTGEAEKYWPRWRGPSGQGVVEPGGYPDRWSDTENVVWKIQVPGAGNSSPIVWADRLFLTTAYDGGQRRAIVCFRRSDGELLWEASAPQAEPEKAYRKNGHASGTPTTDGQRVWAYFGSHGLLCVDFEGRQVWHQDLGSIRSLHGTACSPLLYRDRVIVYQNQSTGAGFIVALDKETGEEIWRTARRERVGWGSPVAIRVDDRDEIIASSQGKVYAYDPQDGTVLWTCRGNSVEVIPTPVVGHGLLYCCSGRVGPTLAIRPGGSGDVTATRVAWQVPTGSPFVPSPLLYGDYLYMVNDMASVARCYDARTGQRMWQGRLGEPANEGFSASPVGVDGKVFFTNDQGETFVLAAGPEFELLHVNRMNERMLATPALVDGRWYVRTEKHLYCIGKE